MTTKTKYQVKRKPTDKQLEKVREKRSYLKSLSLPLKELVGRGLIPTINEGLKAIYETQGHTNLKPLREWNKQGYSVKKGEKALLLWGKPIKKQDLNVESKNEDQEDQTFDMYPLCYLFSSAQVKEREVINE